MISIRRGTTPTVKVTVGMDLTGYACYLSVGADKFDKVTLDNSQMQMSVDEGSTVLDFTFTQKQTLSLTKGQSRMQLRLVKGDVALASEMTEINVTEIIKDGELCGI